MSRRADNSLRNPAENDIDADLDGAWDLVPESTAVPLGAVPRSAPPPSSLSPVTIAPRPRSSGRVPAATASRFSARPGVNDEPTLEVGFEFLDEALLDLGDD
jgi:hypothetical protein